MTGRPIQRAEIVAVGSELLGADRLDTNSLFITGTLNAIGVDVAAKTVVGDVLEDLVSVVAAALARCDLVVLTGGLGPTDDDLTRDAVARVLGRGLREHAPVVERIRARFATRGLSMPEINRRQALAIEGASLLENRQGTAPGQWVDADGRLVVLLPGPPREMKPMWAAVLDELIAPRTAGTQITRRTVRLAGRSESQADEMLQPWYRAWAVQQPRIDATILASAGMIELQLRVTTPDAGSAAAALADAVRAVETTFGVDVISNEGLPLEVVVGHMLRARGFRLAVAESCTGGLIASRLTDIAGSSDYFERGVVAYSNAAKTDMLGVQTDVIARHGAVSEPVASAMAAGVRRVSGVDVGVAVTGIAGPGGATDAKPVGTVVIAVDGPGAAHVVRTSRFAGDRDMVKTFSSTLALDLLRRTLVRS